MMKVTRFGALCVPLSVRTLLLVCRGTSSERAGSLDRRRTQGGLENPMGGAGPLALPGPMGNVNLGQGGAAELLF